MCLSIFPIIGLKAATSSIACGITTVYEEVCVCCVYVQYLCTALARGTPGVEQNNPKLLPGVEKVDSSVATARSHMATS